MNDKYKLLRESLHELQREASAKGGHNPRSQMILDLLAERDALQAENDRLTRYYKNGIDCFANPCEEHSGEGTPPFPEFFERYGGQCLICVVDNNKALHDEIMELKRALAESRANDLTAMGYLNQIRGLVGAADLPDMVRRCEKLRAECEKLRNLLRHAYPIIKAHVGASHMLDGFRPKRNQWDELVETIDAAMQKEDNP